MQAKISGGNDYLPFPQVIGGNLPESASSLREVFIVRVRAEIIKLRDVSFYPVSDTLTRVTNSFLPLKSLLNLSNLILFPKKWTVLAWLFNPLSRKTSSVSRKGMGKQLLSLFQFFHIYRVKEKCQAKVKFVLECHLKHSVF